METITFYRLIELFKDRKTLNKLNKGNFIAKEIVYDHDKSSKGHNIHFCFETPNFENFFTIIVKLNSFEGFGNDDIELYLLAGYISGFVRKRIPNTYDDFFKTLIQLRDEYIEYKGEFRESNKEESDKKNQVEIEKQKQLDKMKSTLDKYL
ncbi:hypothetical protein HOS99_gp135 [Staphylococcus phage phiSA_BS1]|uniref:Uncharacterized protein n=2 Tax=Baoshanvirus TaxID=2732969 RepID=A0A2P1MXU1_9CAUD|nr:hypothetical protein HOS99_gp135 [Staphylococcus phage phiSA_BS1]YP_009799855.1 hypothetical protein HOT02_gp014 [Staphylococcus phage phiSA_BS2]AVP40376.1 hypothetical protein [Staphylococcus phage phiSA_BS1]AVR55459.1 hypothetical protein phiSABS2_14 [Staphylococcus phage phiSA_BS2]